MIPLALVWLFLPATLTAQVQQSIQSTAYVESPLSGAAAQHLSFGTLVPGIPKTVQPQQTQASCSGCTSGKWVFGNLVQSGNNKVLRVTFSSLPSALTHSSGATLPIDWTNGLSGYELGNATPCITATPTQGASFPCPFKSNKNQPATVELYLGGTANPTVGQRAGTYIGTISIQYAYSSS